MDPNTGKMYISRDVVFEEKRKWIWEESTKFKSTAGMSFSVEGIDFNDGFYEDDDEWDGAWVPDTPDQGSGPAKQSGVRTEAGHVVYGVQGLNLLI